jgi:hypothetical protein
MQTLNLGRIGIVNKGAYIGGTTIYKVNDICMYNNSVYICIQAHSTNHLPTDVLYWTAWIDLTQIALLASPALTGTPTAPTPTAGTNNTQLATTGFVIGEKGGRRNYLINGNFDKWDYATSQTTAGYGSDNRWYNGNVGSTKTHSQVACTDTERALFNAMYFSRTVVSSVAGAGNYAIKQQSIENVNILAGKTITLSFWAKADSPKNIAIEFLQVFGTGGTPSASTISISSQLVSLTTTWQKKTITVTIPSIVGKTLGTDGVQTTATALDFWFDSGSNTASRSANLGQQSGTFDIAQVKIEDGLVATNAWYPYDGEFGGEVAACQRYFSKIQVAYATRGGVTTGVNRISANIGVPMRINPSLSIVGSITIYSATTSVSAALSTLGTSYSTTTSMQCDGTTSASLGGSQGDMLIILTDPSGYISLSAEL